ncbi:YtcA family lipoprotein [Dyella soli]|uniref:Uncharacterized protein YtcA n=1 Tax=Dyella soli TaxID=522319 RepID=A0A4R0YMU1_9GAMM|nr:YtcA family lipoprotein [Dyella soli]TCI10076.1 hypothetical protein EZM97_14190 [Dyella soli]
MADNQHTDSPRSAAAAPPCSRVAKERPSAGRGASVLLVGSLLQACSGAPSRNILGSYFPSWMVCALFALILTIIVHAIFVRSGIDATLPVPLIAYLGLFAAFTFATWLIWLA